MSSAAYGESVRTLLGARDRLGEDSDARNRQVSERSFTPYAWVRRDDAAGGEQESRLRAGEALYVVRPESVRCSEPFYPGPLQPTSPAQDAPARPAARGVTFLESTTAKGSGR
jgi:hypothetical protein